jgi:hypothetical protein
MQVALNTRVSVDTAQNLDLYAKASGMSKAAIVEIALKNFFEKDSKNNK